MQTKLTLSVEETLIQQAKSYAKANGKSVSQLVAEFFTVISSTSTENLKVKAKPVTEKLLGCMATSNIDENDYKEYLLSKYK